MNQMFFERKKCPSCGSLSTEPILKYDFTDPRIKNYMYDEYGESLDIRLLDNVPLEFWKCDSCQLGFQNIVFKEEYLHKVYDEWIDQECALQDHKKAGGWKVDYNRRILQYAKNYLKKTPHEIKVLDFGAGFGESLFVAKKMGFHVYALEYSKDRVNYLVNNGIKVISDDDENTFDFIILDQVLEHSTFPNNVLKKLYKKLDQNGLIYLAVPNCSSFEKRLKKSESVLDRKEFYESLRAASVGPFSHINFFNNSNLRAICEKNGLKRVFPIEKCLIMPVSFKSSLRPLYHFFFSTVFFLRKG